MKDTAKPRIVDSVWEERFDLWGGRARRAHCVAQLAAQITSGLPADPTASYPQIARQAVQIAEAILDEVGLGKR